MRILFVAIILIFSLGALGQKDRLEITIRNCFSGFSYSYYKDTVQVNMKVFNENGDYVPYVYKTRLSNADSARFIKAVNSFLLIKEDEIFSNEGVRDGFNFKINITAGERVKRIFVGNAYEERADSLTSIFNRYFSQKEWMKNSLKSNGAGYWGDKEWIEALIRDDKKSRLPLSEENRRFYLDKFCEK